MGERSEQRSAVANRLSRQRDRERGVRDVLLRLPNEVIAKLDAQAEQVGRSRAHYLAHVLAHTAIAANPVQVIEGAPRDLVDLVTTHGGPDSRRRGLHPPPIAHGDRVAQTRESPGGQSPGLFQRTFKERC